MRTRINAKNGYVHARSCDVSGRQTYGAPSSLPKQRRYYVVCWGLKKYITAEQVDKFVACGAKVMEE